MNPPLVSVCLITYNHEKYIRQAIDSILMQVVDFSWELIIADDFSVDKTRAIILEYKEKYPDFIKLIFQEKNVGAAQNWIDLMNAPKSKYCAYIEGDDFWTDTLKLQKQFIFLEKNIVYSACFTNIDAIINENLKQSVLGLNNKRDFDKESIFEELWIPTLTFFFRTNSLIKPLPKEFLQIYTGDLFMFYLIAQEGRIKYLDFISGVYRNHQNGAWSGLDQFTSLKTMNKTYSELKKYFYENKIATKFFISQIQKNKWKEVMLFSKLKNKKQFFLKYLEFLIKNPKSGLVNGGVLVNKYFRNKYLIN